MRIGIDAANLREGGGVTHLVQLLGSADPERDGFSRVTVWSGRNTLAELAPRPWLDLRRPDALDGGLLSRTWWQARALAHEAARACDVLFVPGGTHSGAFRPFVTMCRNMLVFDASERQRYGRSVLRFKLEALRRTQSTTFLRSDGLILLTDHARAVVTREIGLRDVPTRVIPHGVDASLFAAPRPQLPIESYSPERPFRLLYVSKIDLYKHQWNVAEAVALLRKQGVPVTITFVGGEYPAAARRLRSTLDAIEGAPAFVQWERAVPRIALGDVYRRADAFVFASTCENLPNILIEAMAAGLPIAAADRPPMPDVLGSGGLYFNSDSIESIAGALRQLITDPSARRRNSDAAFARAHAYSWERCARDTFDFLRAVAAAPRPAAA